MKDKERLAEEAYNKAVNELNLDQIANFEGALSEAEIFVKGAEYGAESRQKLDEEIIAYKIKDFVNKHHDNIMLVQGEKIAKLEAKLKLAVEALETLKVAVNDKVDDPGATNFIARTLEKIGETHE